MCLSRSIHSLQLSIVDSTQSATLTDTLRLSSKCFTESKWQSVHSSQVPDFASYILYGNASSEPLLKKPRILAPGVIYPALNASACIGPMGWGEVVAQTGLPSLSWENQRTFDLLLTWTQSCPPKKSNE